MSTSAAALQGQPSNVISNATPAGPGMCSCFGVEDLDLLESLDFAAA
ncbi:hypothetical protein GS461_04020, partial [Rhodococcus hoagii]|nr:hypothetical protein [Prescottella equi]